MNRYTDSYIEKDNQMTIGKLTNKTVYTFEEHATYENFSEAFLKQLIGVKMNYTQQLKQKTQNMFGIHLHKWVYIAKKKQSSLKKERVATFTIRMAINI